MSRAQHIGIVACSAEGAALCYQTLCRLAADRMGEHQHPELSMHTYSLADYMNPIRRGDWPAVAAMMHHSGAKLQSLGASFLICPDNTIHQAFIDGGLEGPLPWLSIAEVVAAAALNRGYRRIGVLGTQFLMEGPVYSTELGRHGLEMMIPREEERREINRVIFEQLVYGDLRAESRDYFNQVIQRLQDNGCQAVVLGCTEIPLLVDPETSPLPTLDSTRLLAAAALARSLG